MKHEKINKDLIIESPMNIALELKNPLETPRQTCLDFFLQFFLRLARVTPIRVGKSRFENALKTKTLYQRLRRLELAMLIFSLVGIFAGVIYVLFTDKQFNWCVFGKCNIKYPPQYDETAIVPIQMAKYMTWICLISTALLFFSTMAYYMEKLELLKEQNVIFSTKTFYTSGLIWKFMLESAINLPCPLPFLLYSELELEDFYTGKTAQWRWNTVLSIYSLLRVLILSRYFFGSFEFGDPRSSRICVKCGLIFIMRCTMKNHLFIFIVFSILALILCFGHAIKVTEKALELEGESFVGISNYMNAFWSTAITMTTVGYGDYYPKSIPGRMIVFIVCILGTVVISMMVFLVNSFLTMSDAEANVMNILVRMQKRKEVINLAGWLLTGLVKMWVLTKALAEADSKKEKKIKEERKKVMDRFKLNRVIFSRKMRELRNMGNGFSDREIMRNHFTEWKGHFMEVNQKQKRLVELNERINSTILQQNFNFEESLI